MKKKKMVKSEDGKCPHCSSDYVLKEGGIGAEACSLPESPDTKVFIWKCYSCNKSFYCLAE